MELELTTSPTEEDAQTISKGLVEFNTRSVPELDREALNFYIFARDEKGQVAGGLRAVCFWNTLHIEVLWVSEEIREQGIGTALVELAERYAVKNGFELSLLESTSWQARSFYEKQGYRLLGSLPDYPKGHTMYFMTKKLSEKFSILACVKFSLLEL